MKTSDPLVAPVVGGTPEQLRYEASAARSAAKFVTQYAKECCRHTEAVSECPHCNLNFLASYATRAADYFDAALVPRPEPREPEPQPCPKCGDTTADRVVRCGMCGWTWNGCRPPASAPSLEEK